MELLEKIIFVTIGWALSVLTFILKEKFDNRNKKKSAYFQLLLILEDLIIDIDISEACREANMIETTIGLFDLNESHKYLIPLPPPTLPSNYDNIVDEISKLEISQGNHSFVKKLRNLKSFIAFIKQLYVGLDIQAKYGKEHISDRALEVYKNNFPKIRVSVVELLNYEQLKKLKIIKKRSRKK